MADATVTVTDENKALNIPPEVEEKFHDLVEMIKVSSSMDDEERQYWVDVLPIMSEDQIGNLQGILDNEKKQLAAAAADYSSGMENNMKTAAAAFNEKTYMEKKRIRQEEEARHEAEEVDHEANLLAELDNL